MKLEQQVCNLTLAKRLEELGVKQESSWLWVDGRICWYKENEPNSCSAFTVAELGEMLPHLIEANGKKYTRFCNQNTNVEEVVNYVENDLNGNIDHWSTLHSERAKTEADARAKMLIHLIENKLIKC